MRRTIGEEIKQLIRDDRYIEAADLINKDEELKVRFNKMMYGILGRVKYEEIIKKKS